jgi:hypothetical protein
MSKFNTNPLKKWVLTNKYWVKTTDTKENKSLATHYLLDGGIWKIPKSEYLTFLQLLSTDLVNGEKHYICENRTPVFKFMCDLDFYEDKVITLEQIKTIVQIINQIVEEYYGETKIIICGSESKTVKINENEMVKSGFHLVWPKIWITTENAKKLRVLFVEKLKEHWGERESFNPWSDVVDLSVYEDNALRMVGCRKIAICSSCKNKKEFKESCLTCSGTGKIDENRVYSPICTMGGEHEGKDIYTILLNTSIYNYANFDETTLLKELQVDIKTIKKERKFVEQQTSTMIKIENFIKKNFKESHNAIKLKKLTKDKNDERWFAEPTDNFCINVNRTHSSSGIYFQIKPSGISQRCYCKKDTLDGRKFGPCTAFASEEIPMGKALQTLLFGIVKTKKNKKLINFNITRNSSENENTPKQICLENCKNILFTLENELI